MSGAQPGVGFRVGARLAAALVALTLPASAGTMTFRWADAATCAGRCSSAIVAEGSIEDGAAERFRAMLQASGDAGRHPLVILNSPGGKIVAAMELGEAFRRAGATVTVAAPADYIPQAGICFSSCVYAFMGAARRVAPPGSQIGVHRIFAWNGAKRHFAGEAMTAMLKRYTLAMGVSAELVAVAEQIDPSQVRILTASELARWRLTTASF